MPLPELLPAEAFFAPPERTSATLSPDGTRIAFLAPWKDRLNVWVGDVDAIEDARCVTADGHRSIGEYHWADDPRWLLYLQDDDGDEHWHVHRVDLDDPDAPAVDLTPFPGARVFRFEQPFGRPGTATVAINHRTPAEIDFCEIDIATGAFTVLSEGAAGSDAGMVGPDGEQYGVTPTPEGHFELRHRDRATGTQRVVTEFDGADHPLGLHPARLTPDGTGMWVGSHRGSDRLRLVRIDLATGEETDVDSHPRFDLDLRSQVFPGLPSPLIVDRATGELIGVRYYGERQVIQPLTPHFASVLEHVEALSDGDLGALSSDVQGRRWVAAFTHDREPGVTWLYDHATGEARVLFRPRPDLDPDAMAPMTPVTITARDGLPLPSYLTLPVGVDPVGLPTVLIVHGGPWTRDAWGFDPSAQFFANRGYAVLQVNFRGSTGFGSAHAQAALGQFAGTMHDDLVDAVRWTVEQGYSDPSRVAIFGGSYGGYATLVGITATPDLFAAAVDYVGISNLATFMRALPEALRPGLVSNWYRYVGDPEDPEQEADMLARSPITYADRITTPLMVFQGANDVRVPQAESDAIVSSLRDRGVEVDYRIYADEGHMFSNPENLVDMFSAAGRFFAEHLGGRP